MISQVVLAFILAKWAAELWLSRLNERHVRAQGDAVPEAFKDKIDQATYAKSVQYTLAKSRFGRMEDTSGTLILLVVLFSGVLPWGFRSFANSLGESAWTMAGFLFVIGVALALPGLPFDWHGQFRLEARFGFNTTTPKLWWLDRNADLRQCFPRRPGGHARYFCGWNFCRDWRCQSKQLGRDHDENHFHQWHDFLFAGWFKAVLRFALVLGTVYSPAFDGDSSRGFR